MSAQHEHTRNLEKLCRVCGNAIRKWKNKSKKNKRCSAYSEKIQVKYGINIQADEHHRHPSQICHLCYSNLFLPKPHHPPNEWPPHPERGTCTVCAKVDEVKTGRPAAKYARLERLDTDEATAKEVVSQHFNTLAETTTIFVRDNFTTDESSICCQICSQILNRPVETQCHHIFCLDCLQVVFNRSSSSSVLCPSCHKHTSLKDTSPVREYFLNILGNAKVTCRTCNRSSWLNSTSSHDCKDPLTSQHIDEHIFRDLIKRNMSASGKLGQQVTSTLLKQQIQSDGGTVRLSTGGKAMYVQRITHPRKSSDDVSKRTLFRRTKLVKDKLQEVSGNKATEQLSHMLRTATRHDLQHLLKKIKFTTYIPPLEELALKSDISLSWAALRELKLWLRQYNIIMANEQTTRKVSQMSVGQDILEGERLPFVANDHGSLVSKPAPCVFITDLKKYVLGLLDDYERCGKLQWTEGMPKEEIWLKLGGDKGGGSFKMMLEVANIANPNSRRDTSVICVYESSDTAPNLHIALEKYKEQVESISNTSWRGKKLVVFLFGDYEFLCRMYGLSGPSGRHPCLWCCITSKDMALPKASRPPSDERTLQKISNDYKRFTDAGSLLKNAKNCNNVIGKVFFDIPTTFVCPPSLHISLGVWFKLFTLFEEECNGLLENIVEALAESPQTVPSLANGPFPLYVAKRCEVVTAKNRAQEIATEIDELREQMAVVMLIGEDVDVNEVMTDTTDQIKTLQEELDRQEAIAAANIKQLPSEQNPLLIKLEETLQEIKVRRQAYYSNTFIGNHVHKCLKEVNIHKLTSVITDETSRICPAKMNEAKCVANKFASIFHLFSQCHNVYNASRYLSETEITKLDENVRDFLHFFRCNFPSKSIPPKMHMMEDHIIPFIRRTKHGMGLLCEQGGESMHAVFNILERRFGGTRNTKKKDPDLHKLQCIMREHLLNVNPSIANLCPQRKPRKLAKSSASRN